MARDFSPGTLAALLGYACVLAGQPAAGVALHAGSQAALRHAGAAIPQSKLDTALNPSLASKLHVPGQGGRAAGQGIGSTPGQDQQRCPVMKLPELLSISADKSSWWGQSGLWQTQSNLVLASWAQKFFSQSWQTVYLMDLNRRPTFKAEVFTPKDLKYLYDWRAGIGPSAYPKIFELEAQMRQDAFLGYSTTLAPDGDNVVQIMQVSTGKSVGEAEAALLDCDGRLLFVVHLEDFLGRPGRIDIYDRAGQLAAHAITDTRIARYQFVDQQGYLLATAESPGIMLNISAKDLPRDPSKGNIPPFAVRFESGGYSNASRLLDMDYRWVIAAAVQMRAIRDAHGSWTPPLHLAMIGIYWGLAVITLIAVGCTCFIIYRLVHAPTSKRGLRGAKPWSLTA